MEDNARESASEKPRYLLPDGCKDLIDLLRLQQRQATDAGITKIPFPDFFGLATPIPKVPLGSHASVAIPDPIALHDLAEALHLKPFQLIGALMEFNMFATINTELDFATASALCSHFGVTAIKVF